MLGSPTSTSCSYVHVDADEAAVTFFDSAVVCVISADSTVTLGPSDALARDSQDFTGASAAAYGTTSSAAQSSLMELCINMRIGRRQQQAERSRRDPARCVARRIFLNMYRNVMHVQALTHTHSSQGHAVAPYSFEWTVCHRTTRSALIRPGDHVSRGVPPPTSMPTASSRSSSRSSRPWRTTTRSNARRRAASCRRPRGRHPLP